MKWGPQATVAIIMAFTVLAFAMINSPLWVRLAGYDPITDAESAKAWTSIMAAVVGALSVYIAGNIDK